MTDVEFWARIREHPDLDYQGLDATMLDENGISAGRLIVWNDKTKVRWGITPRAVLDGSWEDMRSVLEGTREPNLMKGYSRIMDYWSRVANWNRSKHAELRDRHRGNYSLPEGKYAIPQDDRLLPGGGACPLPEGTDGAP